MPSTRFETRSGWLAGRHADLIAAIQSALVEGLHIPENDRDIRVLEYPADAFAPPPGRGPHYSVVEISLISGRSPAAKARLYTALQRELATYGIAVGELKIILHEAPYENWGIRGEPLSATNIGFKVEV